MTPQQTAAALAVAERFSAIECAVLDRWPETHVESNPAGATMFLSTRSASIILTMAFSTFTSGHNVLIRRYDGIDDLHRLHVVGPPLHVADEVAEALEPHFGPVACTAPAAAR